MRFHPIALAVALSSTVSAVPVGEESHQAKALGLWQKPADNSTQHVRFAVISPGTADGAIFNALCTLGLPTTHLTKTCSTSNPMIGTDKQCLFKHQGLDPGTQAENFPAATRSLELQSEAEECIKRLDHGKPGGNVPRACQVGKWTNEYRTTAMNLHETPLSGAGAPFHAFSMFWSDMRPKTTQHDKWFFIYSHRDPREWFKDRVKSHPSFPVCNIKDPQISKMTEDDMSPLDPFACLFFCVYNKIAAETDGLNKCMTTISELGEDLGKKAYRQHKEVALRVAKESFKTPVLELNLWTGGGMNAAELVKTLKNFVARSTPGKRKKDPEFSIPCMHGTDSNPMTELRKAEPNEDESLSDAEPYMSELAELKQKLMSRALEQQ